MFDKKQHCPVRIFPSTHTYFLGTSKIARELDNEERKALVNYYSEKGFRVKFEF